MRPRTRRKRTLDAYGVGRICCIRLPSPTMPSATSNVNRTLATERMHILRFKILHLAILHKHHWIVTSHLSRCNFTISDCVRSSQGSRRSHRKWCAICRSMFGITTELPNEALKLTDATRRCATRVGTSVILAPLAIGARHHSVATNFAFRAWHACLSLCHGRLSFRPPNVSGR